MYIRNYMKGDSQETAELFYNTVHVINKRDYTDAQIKVWAPENRDLKKWNESFSGRKAIVAVEENHIVGFCDITDSGYLDRLYVHSEFQGKGAGKALCREAEKYAADRLNGIVEVYGSITARPFFESLGYSVVRDNGVIRDGISLKNFYMKKELPKRSLHLESTPPLETERLMLRKFTFDDIDDMYSIYSDESVNKFLPWFPFASKAETEKYLRENIMPQYENQFSCRYCVELKETGKVIGYVSLGCIDLKNRSGDLGYGLMKEYWNRGIITEASKEILKWLKDCGFRCITATHDVNNPASGEVMKKLGMKYRCSYDEMWQPKNFKVTFKLYRIDF